MQIAKEVPARNYLDIDAHRALKHGTGASADFHRGRRQADAVDSGSGDGESQETAYLVVSTDEEYPVEDRLGLLDEAQSLVERQGHHYDALLVSGKYKALRRLLQCRPALRHLGGWRVK